MLTYDPKKRSERQPGWRTSEGRMREESARPEKSGKAHMTGYEQRRDEENAPRETGRLAGSYGGVAVGVSRKKQVVMTVAKRRSRRGPAAEQDEKRVRGQNAKKINLARGDFQTNTHDPKKSAVIYRESDKKTPGFLMNRFRQMSRTHQQQTVREQAPFLSRNEEIEELRKLESKAVTLRAKNEPGTREQVQAIERRKQELRQILTEKRGDEHRLEMMLRKAQEKSRLASGETLQLPQQTFLQGFFPEEPPENPSDHPDENESGRQEKEQSEEENPEAPDDSKDGKTAETDLS